MAGNGKNVDGRMNGRPPAPTPTPPLGTRPRTRYAGAWLQCGATRYMRTRQCADAARFCHCSSWHVKPMLGFATPRIALTAAKTCTSGRGSGAECVGQAG